jgi:hypothetical protein
MRSWKGRWVTDFGFVAGRKRKEHRQRKDDDACAQQDPAIAIRDSWGLAL